MKSLFDMHLVLLCELDLHFFNVVRTVRAASDGTMGPGGASRTQTYSTPIQIERGTIILRAQLQS